MAASVSLIRVARERSAYPLSFSVPFAALDKAAGQLMQLALLPVCLVVSVKPRATGYTHIETDGGVASGVVTVMSPDSARFPAASAERTRT